MKRKELYLIAFICYAIVTGLAMVRLFDSIQLKDKSKITGAGIWLAVSFIALICFLVLFKKHAKNDIS